MRELLAKANGTKVPNLRYAGAYVAEKLPVSKLIRDLREVGVYDEHTQRRLDLLGATPEGPAEISQKERSLIEDQFSDLIDIIQQDGSVRFTTLAGGDTAPQTRVTCNVKEFLGFGNMGPVYSVSANNRPYALKIYSAREIQDIVRMHGNFGLAGILADMNVTDKPALLSDLGKKVLARKPKGMYARSGRIVKIHNVGVQGNYMYLLMDMLDVDPISKIDPAELGGSLPDLVSWTVDCAVGLCHLHVEEHRLHLNIRPEAFIRQTPTEKTRQPKFTFFHYPKQFYRPPDGASLKTEFIMVDHLDNSVEIGDKGPKGIGTVGGWLYLPPEAILHVLKTMREDHRTYVENRTPVDQVRTIEMKRTQLDDIWALGLTWYQFLSGKSPFGDPKTLLDMVNSILLTKFDFSNIEPSFQDLLSAMLDKDPKKRFVRVLDGCPDKIRSRKVMAEAVLYKLERIGLKCDPGA